MQSIIEARGSVSFPTGGRERVYMHEFTQAHGLPTHLSRWQATVDAMLAGIKTTGPIYLMIDRTEVQRGTTQRRSGLHIDGNWMPAIAGHDTPAEHHNMPSEPLLPMRRWKIPSRHKEPEPETPGHNVPDGGHSMNGINQGLILASDVLGCVGYTGNYNSQIAGGGSVELKTDHLERVQFTPGQVWAGNVYMLHESIPVMQTSLRTIVRLNVEGWEPKN